ncbi:hypothetical protein H8B19_02805 [Neptunicella marina]|uniref:Uncharacterized protein n=1 Tax=Neptunicella marina TaxID=2125989 RepID=A0A8J6IS59_9ALTE|nr:hypothetical protein [Neptunicella marina]
MRRFVILFTLCLSLYIRFSANQNSTAVAQKSHLEPQTSQPVSSHTLSDNGIVKPQLTANEIEQAEQLFYDIKQRYQQHQSQ